MDIVEYAELFYDGELSEYQKRMLRVYELLYQKDYRPVSFGRGGRIRWIYNDNTPIDKETLEECRGIMDGK